MEPGEELHNYPLVLLGYLVSRGYHDERMVEVLRQCDPSIEPVSVDDVLDSVTYFNNAYVQPVKEKPRQRAD